MKTLVPRESVFVRVMEGERMVGRFGLAYREGDNVLSIAESVYADACRVNPHELPPRKRVRLVVED